MGGREIKGETLVCDSCGAIVTTLTTYQGDEPNMDSMNGLWRLCNHCIEKKDEPSNQSRADRAEHAIGAYCIAHPDYIDGLEVDDEIITEMLADLRHYCHANGIDFEMCARMAETHFSEEVDK